MANLYELDAIAAAIIGGTLLSGGRGTIVGSLLGVLVFSTITNLFAINDLSTEVQNMVKGGIIVAAVLVQQFRYSSLTQLPEPHRAPAPRPDRPPSHRRRVVERRSPGPRLSSQNSGGHHDSDSRPVASPDALRRRRARRRRPAHRLHQQRASSGNAAQINDADSDASAGNAAPGKKVIIGFSAPAADHGWIAAITNNAKAQAGRVLRRGVRSRRGRRRRGGPARRAGDPGRAEAERHRAAAARRQGAQRLRPGGDAGRHPGGQPGPGVPGRAGLPVADQGRQLRHGRRRRAPTSPSS